MNEDGAQLQLFVVLLAAQAAEHKRATALAESRHRRDIAAALGQVGNQLALALWRGDDLARCVRRQPTCPTCSAVVSSALTRFDNASLGRGMPRSRILPVLGTAS